MTDVTFVDDCPVYKWQLLKRDLHQMNIQPTQKMTFLIGRTKILRSQFTCSFPAGFVRYSYSRYLS